MNIFQKIKNSIYNPKYYKELLSKPFSYSLKYFLLFALVVALVPTIFYSFSFAPTFRALTGEFEAGVEQRYPGDLEINFKDGNISSNVEEPFFWSLKDAFGEEEADMTGVENLLVIDTKQTDLSLDKIREYKSLVILSQKDVIFYDAEQDKIEIRPVEGLFKDMVINKEKILSIAGWFNSYRYIILPAFILLIFLVSFSGITIKLFYLLFAALLVWGIARIKKLRIGYKKAYQFSLHFITLAVLFDILLFLVARGDGIPFFFTLVLMLSAALNLDAKEGATSIEPSVTDKPSQE